MKLTIVQCLSQQELSDSKSKNRRAETNENSNKIQLILPYSGKKGKKLIAKMKKHIRKTLPENVQAIVTYQSKKLSSKFKVKDKTEFIIKEFSLLWKMSQSNMFRGLYWRN